jgi:hypothetical protein
LDNETNGSFINNIGAERTPEARETGLQRDDAGSLRVGILEVIQNDPPDPPGVRSPRPSSRQRVGATPIDKIVVARPEKDYRLLQVAETVAYPGNGGSIIRAIEERCSLRSEVGA